MIWKDQTSVNCDKYGIGRDAASSVIRQKFLLVFNLAIFVISRKNTREFKNS